MGCLDRYSDEELVQIFGSNIEEELRSRGYEYGWHKKVQYAGEIYILVNPAFPSLVKIGYADNVQKRVKSLNSNSGLPDPYHVYATYKVKKRLEDLKLHKLIDSLDSDLRHTKNKEFYEMSPEKAYAILSAIAEINGDEELLVLNPYQDEFFDGKPAKQPEKPAGEIQTYVVGTVPDGTYYFRRKKKTDNKEVKATAIVKNSCWTLLKGSCIGVYEDVGVSQKAKDARANMKISNEGILLEDAYLGECTPSHAGSIVMNQSNNGWEDWRTENGLSINIYRKK